MSQRSVSMTKDLTTGNPMKLILAFALPTLCGMGLCMLAAWIL